VRKRDPQDVRDGFVDEVGQLEAYFGRVSASLAGTSHEQSDVSQLSEATFLTGLWHSSASRPTSSSRT